jgi:RNA polymerase sigma-70 factor (ECF subfamily)
METTDKNTAKVESEFSDSALISQVRRDMFRFAILQLKDEGLAEDAVQEALIAAHQNRSSFNGEVV